MHDSHAARFLFRSFRWLTLAALLSAAGVAAIVVAQVATAPPLATPAGTQFLSALAPRSATQGWGRLMLDRAVSGADMRMAGRLYLRGLGTHAPGRIAYAVPAGAASFHAVVGIDDATRGAGSVRVIVELDGRPAFQSQLLRGGAPPVAVDLALRGAREIVLRTEPATNGNRSDHLDWALARFELHTAASQP